MFPVSIDASEREIIIDLVRGRKGRIPSVWQQLMDKKDPVMLSSFENGFLMGRIVDERERVPETWKQLIDIMNKLWEEAGVIITELGDGMVRLEDKYGYIIVRQKYEWE